MNRTGLIRSFHTTAGRTARLELWNWYLCTRQADCSVSESQQSVPTNTETSRWCQAASKFVRIDAPKFLHAFVVATRQAHEVPKNAQNRIIYASLMPTGLQAIESFLTTTVKYRVPVILQRCANCTSNDDHFDLHYWKVHLRKRLLASLPIARGMTSQQQLDFMVFDQCFQGAVALTVESTTVLRNLVPLK